MCTYTFGCDFKRIFSHTCIALAWTRQQGGGIKQYHGARSRSPSVLIALCLCVCGFFFSRFSLQFQNCATWCRVRIEAVNTHKIDVGCRALTHVISTAQPNVASLFAVTMSEPCFTALACERANARSIATQHGQFNENLSYLHELTLWLDFCVSINFSTAALIMLQF